MEKNYGKIRQIAEQLPIGLYAKRRIETDLSEGETGSYYAPLQLVRYITLVSMNVVYISIIRYS